MSITSSTLGKRTFKVILLGQTSTGKTCIIERFVNNKFEQKENPTIGIDFLGKNVTHNANTCRLQLWDTAGQQRYRSLIPSYLKDAVCAVFVFDLARNETLQNLHNWIELFRDNRGERTIMAVCGNKNDLAKDFDEQVLKELLEKYKMKYYETSALTGNNIQGMFLSLIEDISLMQQSRKKRISQEDSDILPPLTTQKFQSEKMTAENESQNEGEGRTKLKSEAGFFRRLCCRQS